MKKKTWPLKRIKQLEAVEDLIRECRSLNSGNNVIGRMQRCIGIAEMLDRTNLNRREPRFIQFLRDLAIPAEDATR